MEEIDRVQLREDAALDEDDLFALLDKVRKHETIYKQAGAVHGCALAHAGARSSCSSRTSAATTRWTRSPASCGWKASTARDKVFYTTGRLTSEMVIKCAQMRIPFLVSRSGLTKMGHDIARQVGLTMIGRAINRRYLLFTGGYRFARRPPGE